MPIIGSWPELVHVLTGPSTGTRTENGFRRHASVDGDREVVELDGVRLTGVVDTLLDLAIEASFATAVAALDFALRAGMVSKEQLRVALAARGGIRAYRRVERVLDFATALSGSPGESLSRVTIHELGFPVPILQHPFSDALGHIGDVDFWWPEFELMGEFDGLVKYTRDEYRKGRSIEEIVFAEKVREDRLRAPGRRMARWLWATALNPRMLYARLAAAGLPPASAAFRANSRNKG